MCAALYASVGLVVYGSATADRRRAVAMFGGDVFTSYLSFCREKPCKAYLMRETRPLQLLVTLAKPEQSQDDVDMLVSAPDFGRNVSPT